MPGIQMAEKKGKTGRQWETVTIDDVRWDETVSQFKYADVHYMRDYAKAFQINGDGEPELFYFNNGTTRAINVVMKRDIAKDAHFINKIPKGKYFDLATPYGYGGFVFEGTDSDSVSEAYKEYCVENGYICEFVRFGLFSEYVSHYSGEVRCCSHNVVRNLELEIDELLGSFEHKVRKNIKKAERNGLEILVEQDTSHIEEFLRIYYGTMQRANASSNYYFKKEFFENISKMKEHIAYFYALYEKQVISAELILFGSQNAYSFLGGTDSRFFALRPNDFLKFEAMKWLRAKGLKRFVLGGGYGADDGIFRYKKSFAPNGIVNFYIGKKIFDREVYEKLVEIRKEENPSMEPGYFPLYRA